MKLRNLKCQMKASNGLIISMLAVILSEQKDYPYEWMHSDFTHTFLHTLFWIGFISALFFEVCTWFVKDEP